MLTWGLDWGWPAREVWISCKGFRARANRSVIYNMTDSQEATCSIARILATSLDASLIVTTNAIIIAFWYACNIWVSLKFKWTGTYSISSYAIA